MHATTLDVIKVGFQVMARSLVYRIECFGRPKGLKESALPASYSKPALPAESRSNALP